MATDKKPFKEQESYLHKFAKNLLVKWLREIEQKNNRCVLKADGYCNHVAWRSNYGVYPELKFYETSHPYYFEQSSGIIQVGNKNQDFPDSLFEPTFNRGKILFVPDITIFHRGQAQILIEVVNTNPVSDKKLNDIKLFFGNYFFELLTIRAKDVLKQTSFPKKLPFQELYINHHYDKLLTPKAFM